MDRRFFKSWYLTEFLVIVFSILLAFALERWYESYLDDKYLDELLRDVGNELLFDYKFLDERFSGEQYNLVNKMIQEDSIPANHNFLRNFGFSSMVISDDSYSELKKFSKEIPSQYDSLLTLLNELKNRFASRINNKFNNGIKLQEKYFDHLMDKEWFYNFRVYGQLSDTGKQYFLNDTYTKSLILNYRNNLRGFLIDFYNIRKLTILSIIEFSRQTGDNDIINQLPQNHRSSFTNEFESVLQGQYYEANDSDTQYNYSFIDNYLAEEINGDYDFYYSINDSTFYSLYSGRELAISKTSDGQVNIKSTGLFFSSYNLVKANQPDNK